ncbi:MAG: molybdenum cofactor synthesis domain protein, partial [Thermomicrobiales bacterium]|nr:molybdenum cofactor synthesis domain protein [Thermomicrobiales bacterium]
AHKTAGISSVPEPTTPLIERPWEDIERMLDVDAALQQVLSAFAPLEPVSVPLLDAATMVLAADAIARDDVPPFRNSAMDGYAVRAADTASATWSTPAQLPVAAYVAAGQGDVPRLGAGEAIRIMTGAPLPDGADAVVRFEETDESGSAGQSERETVLVYRAARLLDNVREAGEDIARGTLVVRRGQVLRPADLGLIASIGQPSVHVHRRPVVAVLSTGNEVLAPGEQLKPGTIRDSNSFVIGALARSWGADVRLIGIARDTVADLTGRLAEAENVDLIVTSGGVSLGDYDLVKDVLKSEGEIAIWQVRMKPGKPLAFGHIGMTPLLGLPGNPVAAAVSFIIFGRPAIRTMLGHAATEPRMAEVVTADGIDNRGHRRHYVRVRLEPVESGPLLARIAGEQGAGVLSSLAAADALMIVPEELERVQPGTCLWAILLDW